MRKKKTISIKDPRLQKIRNNFRGLWLKVAHIQIMQLLEERRRILFDDDKLFEIRNYSRELNRLEELRDHSICKCRACVRSDQDMTYNPRDRAWYCVECYEDLHRWTSEVEEEPWRFP